MPKSTFFDEILEETKNYRCEYLEILIKKYVKTEDEVVDIHIRNCTVTKSTNYLKRIGEKPFGYLSSYDCKSAKKTLHCWKKKIILHKRTSFRRHVGVESFDEDYHFSNAEEKSNYLTPSKAYKTLLSIQESNLCSSIEESENTLSNQTDLGDDKCSISFVEENENNLSYEDSPNLSDTVEKIKSKVLKKDKTIKSLLTSDKSKLLLPNNGQELQNFKIKNCNANLLKSNNHEQVKILIEHCSSAGSNKYDGSISKIKHQKMAMYLKGMILSSKEEKGISTNSIYSAYNSQSLSDYFSSKYIPKFKFSEIGMGISNKNCHVSSVCNVKPLLCNSNKSIKAFKSTTNKIEMESSNKNSKVSWNSNASNKSIESFKIDINKIEMETAKKTCNVSNDCSAKLVFCSGKKSAEPPKIEEHGNRTSKNNCQISSDCSAQLLPYSTNQYTKSLKLNVDESVLCAEKSAEPSKFKAYEKKIESSKNNSQISSDCSAKLLPYSINQSTKSLKLKIDESEMQVSNKASSVCNSKSLICAPSKSVESLTHRFSKTVTRTCNKNCQSLLNSTSLKSTSVSFPLTPNLENFGSTDPLSLKKVSDDKKVHKKKASLTQASLPLCKFQSRKKYTSSFENDCKIDDLSLKKVSDDKKMHKKKASLTQTSLPLCKFQSHKKYTSYFENDCKIDDLSLKKVSDDKKMHKKEASLTQTSLPLCKFRSCKKYTSYFENECKIDDLSLKKVLSPQQTPKNK